jgi:hypothetical protein
MNLKYTSFFLFCSCLCVQTIFAGNPDRQGEAGANQLLINPWARSAGLHTLNTSMATGIDAMYINVAGVSRINKMQVGIGNTRYLEGTGIQINSLGFASKIGRKGGALGISLVTFNFGDIPVTTENSPEGTGATFSPSFVNVGLSYSHTFSNRVSVGVTAKAVNESLANISARAVALDAGVQYVTGPKDNFKFGISLRNVGSKMQYTGEGIAKQRPSGNVQGYPITYYERSAPYELPSQLNIGTSYDFLFARVARLTVLGNFTSNSFSRDQYGLGAELGWGQFFALRVAYKDEFDQVSGQETLDNGLSAGLTISAPLKKGADSRLSFDYAYRTTDIYRGIHNIGIRLDL